MFIKHAWSEPEITLAPVPAISNAFSRVITSLISGFLTEKVPPKPQQRSARGNSIKLISLTFLRSLKGGSLMPIKRVTWQDVWYVTDSLKRAPTSSTPNTSVIN